MSKVTLVVEFALKPHMIDAYKDASARMRAAVGQQEPGTMQYDWWLSAGEARGINIEAFEDSDALAHHMANTAPLIDDLLAAADVVRVEVLGELTDVGRAAIEAAATGYSSLLGGLDR